MDTNLPETLESGEIDIETDNEYYCDLCEHKAQTKGGLKIHMGRKHTEIHRLDGEVHTDIKTDDGGRIT